ncbi:MULTISPECIES: sodium:proton antiporter [Pseudoalteromonas]|jgi:NhaP-type Na+/H+ or K+/H+ antiporter|uniref:Sodium:proton antiporter n=1 Tax=Pseudoalteromonas agarivorans TaxID=176102 RepID=A0AAD0U4X3_9GAMM|nr:MULTISPECIES: cation:proton antiporter [Pseudoalteromonas]AYM88802.1 sodium:proton antiporter [Pseudoalteromonas agarivorans]MCK8105457.1 cation:proton antiporter [Pseudoalteromonas sp. 2CM41L]MDC9500598.1 cation:proton antiporter [Pseudoalteromonas sp. Angola-18]MDC9529999.1 cation:proton antiporter [Pseudoalteromonas sp. Angola-7]
MEYLVIAFIGFLFLVYSISIRQLERTEITGPMFFVIGGMFLAFLLPNEGEKLKTGIDYLLPLIELTLSIFLFSDAAKSKLGVLRHSFQYPSLLLFVALPLTLLCGIGVSLFLFAELSLIQSALLAIILTPTDAALSKGLLQSTQVPEKIREGINTESGLNDGLCVPVFLIFILLAKNPDSAITASHTLGVFSRELGLALLIAGFSIAIFIPALNFAMQRHYFAKSTSPFLLLGFAMAVFSITQYLHGSGFIAVFIAGLLFDKFSKTDIRAELIEDSEHIADFTSLMIWCLFGFVCAYLVIPKLNTNIIVYALLSTTLIRIIPVMLSLQFTALNWKERFTFAWFGPRGLASIVFTLMVIDTQIENKYDIATIAMTTILFSVFIHGISTKPIADSFVKKSK